MQAGGFERFDIRSMARELKIGPGNARQG